LGGDEGVVQQFNQSEASDKHQAEAAVNFRNFDSDAIASLRVRRFGGVGERTYIDG
jgi:hypothetical protein